MWVKLYVIASIINLGLGILLVTLLTDRDDHEPKTNPKTPRDSKNIEDDQALIDFIDEAVKDKPRKG